MTGDCLFVGYDHSSDGSVLTIAREENERVRVLNTIQGDNAFVIYHLLVGNGIIKEKEMFKEIMLKNILNLYHKPQINLLILTSRY